MIRIYTVIDLDVDLEHYERYWSEYHPRGKNTISIQEMELKKDPNDYSSFMFPVIKIEKIEEE